MKLVAVICTLINASKRLATEKTDAIVLRTVEFSETSLVVTLLTRDFGQIGALAKGARRPKGPFEGSLDLLAVCRVVVIHKSSESLDLLTEAKLARRFRGAERSLQRLYAGYYIAEMLRLLTDEHDPHPNVYDLTLKILHSIDGSGDVVAALLYFDAQVLRMLGHAPATDRCTACDQTIQRRTRANFALLGGGVVCPSCRARQQNVVSVRGETLDVLDQLSAPSESMPSSISPKVSGELRSVMNRYIQTLLGKTPKMQSFLQTVVHADRNS